MIDKFSDFAYDITYMVMDTWHIEYREKTWNGKSSRLEAEREKLSPAESSFGKKVCEVHPGVGSVKGNGRVQ